MDDCSHFLLELRSQRRRLKARGVAGCFLSALGEKMAEIDLEPVVVTVSCNPTKGEI